MYSVLFALFVVCLNVYNINCWGEAPHYSEKQIKRMEMIDDLKKNLTLKTSGSAFKKRK